MKESILDSGVIRRYNQYGSSVSHIVTALQQSTPRHPRTRPAPRAGVPLVPAFFFVSRRPLRNLLGTAGDSMGDVMPICRVRLITSPREEQALISANNMKPVVKLLINRHNNKYSYTGASDDNLLKNIELFDKLSLRLEEGVDSRRMRRVEKLFLALKVFHLFLRW